ncbi:resolvase [Clostridiaceae bacterium]|nr:resolvase [Clostridiaceae bacterium]
MREQQNYRAVIYCRLSSEDGADHESMSIGNQRALLAEYVQKQGWEVVDTYIDDGFSGTNFERPGFQEMMRMVKLKKIGCIVVKDLSRFGRDYLEVSSYLELILPVFDIRFLSVNDHFDSQDYRGTTGGMELAFRNLIKNTRHLGGVNC